MKSFSLIIVFTLLALQASFAQQFEIVYSYPGEDHPRSIIQTPDSGYAISGATNSFNSSMSFFLLRTDKNGDGRWVKSYSNNSISWADCIRLTSDSGFIMAGYTNAAGLGGYDGYLVRTDSLGDTLWTKSIGSSDWDFLHHVEQTNDGGFIAAGGSYGSRFGNEDAWIVKTDALGNVQWSKTWGGPNDDEARCVRQCANGDFIVFGNTIDSGKTTKDAYLLRLNSNGDTLWTKTFGDSLDDEGRFVEETTDGGFILAISHTETSDSVKDIQLIKTFSNGDVQFNSEYFQSAAGSEPYEVHESTLCNAYVCTGYYNGGGGGRDFVFLKVDYSLNYLLSPTYGLLKDETSYSITNTFTGFAFCGETESYGTLPVNIYVLGTDCNGVATGIIKTNINDPVEEMIGGSVFPNPAKNICYLSIPGLHKNLNGYSIFSIDGRLVYDSREQIAFNHPLRLDVSQLSQGVYFIRTGSEEKIYNAKVIVVR